MPDAGWEFYDALARWGAQDRQAFLALLKGGLLRVKERQGSLRSVQPFLPAYVCGANADRHYALVAGSGNK